MIRLVYAFSHVFVSIFPLTTNFIGISSNITEHPSQQISRRIVFCIIVPLKSRSPTDKQHFESRSNMITQTVNFRQLSFFWLQQKCQDSHVISIPYLCIGLLSARSDVAIFNRYYCFKIFLI